MRPFATVILLAACLIGAARAQENSADPCKILFRNESAANTVLKSIFDKYPLYSTVKRCSYGTTNPWEEYFLVSDLKKSSSGTCRYSEVKLRIDEKTGAISKDNVRGDLYMAQAEPCPKPVDPSYVRTAGVSEGTFAEAMKLWKRLKAGEAREILLPYADKSDPNIGMWIERAASGKIQLQEIRFLDPWNRGMDAWDHDMNFDMWGHYEMGICVTFGIFLLVVFDTSPTGIQILHVILLAN